jgi:DNA-binding SARP family transcriptional activator/tetratricopeptide (TPR) repeat protein
VTRQVRLQVLGPLRVWRDGLELDTGPRQQRSLLALLLIREGRPISLTDLVGQVWGTDPPVSAVNVVHKYVGALRRLLEPGLPRRSAGSYLLRHGTGYRFTTDPETLDLAMFHRFVDAARDELAEGHLDGALDRYLDALRLCYGPAGDALAGSSAAAAAFASIDNEFFDAAVAAAELSVRAGRPAEVLGPLRTAARMGRLNEPVHACLITTLTAAGQQAEALAHHRMIRDRIAAELGIDPGRELQDAQRQVLTQAAVPAVEEFPQPQNVAAAAPGFRRASFVRPAQLPPDQPLFVGRTIELGVLRDLVIGMRDGGRTAAMVIAVDGMEGVGKSTMVTHFAHTIAAEFTDGQLYLDLQGHQGEDGSMPAGEALCTLLYGLGGRASDLPDTFDALVGTYRSVTAGMRILVLLDNVRDPSQVRPLLPNSVDSLVLITSRRPLTGLTASGGVCLFRIETLDLPEARELLETRLAAMRGRRFGDDGDTDTVAAIVECCGRLPLTLAVLAARLGTRPQWSLAEVADELRDGARRLEAFPAAEGFSDPRTAFSWSYRQLSPGAARLFRLLSSALSPGVTVEACVSLSGRDCLRTRAELAELAEAALIVTDVHGRYTSHLLVKAYATELFRAAESPAERHAAVSRMLQHYLHSSSAARDVLQPDRGLIALPPPLSGVVAERPASFHGALAWFAAHRDVLREAVRLAAEVGYGVAPWQLAVTMQPYLEWYGFFRDGEYVMRLALRAAREQGDVIGEAHVLRCLAGARWFSGADQEAVDLLDAARELFAEHGMPAEQAIVHVNRHEVHSALGRHELALTDAEKAVALNHIAGDLRAEVSSLGRTGQSLTRLGRYEEADRVLRLALTVGGRDQDAVLRVAVARNLAAMNRVGEAREQLDLAAATACEASRGPRRFEVYLSLSEAFRCVGDAAGAQAAYHRARDVLASFPDGGPDRLRAELTKPADAAPASG